MADGTARGPEYTQVERPLPDQLAQLGRTHLAGAKPGTPAPTDPSKSGRTNFSEVFLEERLKRQISAINKGPDGKPWLDERRVSQAVSALTRVATPALLDANQKATELLLGGFTIEGLPDWDGGRDQRVRYINWENPLRNEFTVVSQFRVDIPGTQGRKCIVPDEVLFVNGIPIALIECKKPESTRLIREPIEQHLRIWPTAGARRPQRAASGSSTPCSSSSRRPATRRCSAPSPARPNTTPPGATRTRSSPRT